MTGTVLPRSWSPTLSPDGRQAAYISDRGGRPQVWVQPVRGGAARLIDTGPEPVTEVRWSTGGGWLACRISPGGAPRHEVWLVRPDGSALRQVAGFGADTADNMRWLPGRSLLAVTENLALALLIDPSGGERSTVATGDLISLLDVSPARDRALLRIGPRGARRIVVRDLLTGEDSPITYGEQAVFAPDGVTVVARSENGEFPILLRVTKDAVDTLAGACNLSARTAGTPARTAGTPAHTADAPAHTAGTPAHTADPSSSAAHVPTTAALTRTHGAPANTVPLAAEIESFALTADGRAAAVLWNVRGGESEVELIDLDHGSRRLLAPLPGSVISGLAWSFDGTTLALTAEGPGRPAGVWVWAGDEIAAVAAAPAAAGAVRPTLSRFAAHDGLELSGWLFRPRTDGPHPAVIWLHGGPEAQERPGHSPLFQSLADRGIAVFAPNVRGSAGFGRSFVSADNGPLRYAAIEDVRSAVSHLIGSGVADPARIGCMGRSYGGYLTLAALTRFPELFAVGIDICGMSNFFTFYEHTESWIAAAAVSKYGDPVTDADLLADLSPMTHIDRLHAPLLIIHGSNDTNVPVIEAEQLAEALSARGVPHRYVLFPGEGHELLHRAARTDFLRETVDWLTAHLQ